MTAPAITEYGMGDERRFLMQLGTGTLGHPTMSRLSYLKAYQAALKNRTRFTRELNKGAMLKCVQDAIDVEQAPKRVYIPELLHVGDGQVRTRLDMDGAS